ncbi:hypothetical protein DL96DRAFT_1603432 [Flagelloscypha sp. PMI_526]|nr:hypothetical protein DL96DRAFT_1603432 [Flagelloscypha sp. PMI_526]
MNTGTQPLHYSSPMHLAAAFRDYFVASNPDEVPGIDQVFRGSYWIPKTRFLSLGDLSEDETREHMQAHQRILIGYLRSIAGLRFNVIHESGDGLQSIACCSSIDKTPSCKGGLAIIVKSIPPDEQDAPHHSPEDSEYLVTVQIVHRDHHQRLDLLEYQNVKLSSFSPGDGKKKKAPRSPQKTRASSRRQQKHAPTRRKRANVTLRYATRAPSIMPRPIR